MDGERGRQNKIPASPRFYGVRTDWKEKTRRLIFKHTQTCRIRAILVMSGITNLKNYGIGR